MAQAEGAVRHQGSPAEVMASDVLEDVFGTPVDVRTTGPYPLAVYFR